jgi:hypothetical protein
MESDSNRNEFAQEMLAGNHLRDTVRQVLAESADRLLVESREESRFRVGTTEARAVCRFDNGLRYLVEYDEELRHGEIRSWHTKITNLDTERLTHAFGFLVTKEFFELTNQGRGLPLFTRFGLQPEKYTEQQCLFDAEFATAEMVEDLRQGISSAYFLPLKEAKHIIKVHDKADEAKEYLHKVAFRNLGGHALFMAGVRLRTIKANIFKKDI